MALGLDAEALETIEADLLPGLLASLLNDLRQRNTGDEAEQLAAFCLRMAQAGWPWAGTVAETLELQNRLTPRGTLPEDAMQPADALRVWRTLPKWEENAPRPPPASHAITPLEVRARLAHILGDGAESRAGQADFANVCINAFAPRSMPGDPTVLLAEAGTGTGKTLATSPPPASGPNAMTGRYGSAPIPATCNARSSRKPAASTPTAPHIGRRSCSARAARTICAC